jgi:2-C-methyl-D-erythritol 4-phosphate cytidylyltransferase
VSARSDDLGPAAGRVGAVVVAAGRSARMGADKIWVDLGSRPVLAWSVEALDRSDLVDRLVLVVAPDRQRDAAEVGAGYRVPTDVVVGGERRRDSVGAGLAVLVDCEWIVVHDGARPFVTPDLVARGLAAARDTGAAIAALPAKDTIKRVSGREVVETLSRAELWAVQTPQVFRRELLAAALASTTADVTDEATLVERIGGVVRVFEGSAANFKITTPDDLALARALLHARAPSLAP